MSAQWQQMEPPSKKRALNIIKRLQEGVPPPEDVRLFSIGREELLSLYFAL